jgi:predicted aspartyl protease
MFRFIVDTGATRTVLSPQSSARLELETEEGFAIRAGGNIVSARQATLGSLEIAGFAETRVETMMVRVTQLPFIYGALGLDYLSHFAKISYDFDSHVLELTTRGD